MSSKPSSSILARSKAFTFGVLLAMCTDGHVFSFLSSSSIVLDVLQAASFPLSSLASFPWHNGGHSFARPLSHVLQPFSAVTLDSLASTVRFAQYVVNGAVEFRQHMRFACGTSTPSMANRFSCSV